MKEQLDGPKETASSDGSGAALGHDVLGKLLALLAHDLRNPLSALHSNLGFLASVLEAPESDVNDAIADGLISCDGLTHIISNIDLLGKSLRGLTALPVVPLTAYPFVSELVSGCSSVAQSHGLSLAVEGSAGQAEIRANQEMLERALMNLIRNSIQHSPSGSAVRISVDGEADMVVIRVMDVGSKIPIVRRAEVFTAQGQVASKSSQDGRYSRGMGLYAARLAADVVGARLEVVEPPAGFNNCFELVMPVSLDRESHPAGSEG